MGDKGERGERELFFRRRFARERDSGIERFGRIQYGVLLFERETSDARIDIRLRARNPVTFVLLFHSVRLTVGCVEDR